MQSISSYINPNTRGLTSNYKNTAIKDKETYNEAMSQHLLNPGLSTLFQTNFFRLFFRYCTGV